MAKPYSPTAGALKTSRYDNSPYLVTSSAIWPTCCVDTPRQPLGDEVPTRAWRFFPFFMNAYKWILSGFDDLTTNSRSFPLLRRKEDAGSGICTNVFTLANPFPCVTRFGVSFGSGFKDWSVESRRYTA